MTGIAAKYKPYPAYKPSGVEWLGEMPAHWSVKPLKYVARMNAAVLPESTPPSTGIRYLDIGNVDSHGNILALQEMAFGDAPSRARRLIRAGDTALSTVRTYLKAVAYFPAPEAGTVASTGFAVLSPPESLHPGYLFRFVQSSAFVERVVSCSEGVAYPAINPSVLAQLPAWLPPLPEQRAIADFLDRETGRIDALIEKKRRLIELLEEKRSALISHAVTKGLDPDAPMKNSGIEWLGQIPAHWEVVALSRRTVSRCDGPFGSGLKSDHYSDGGVRVVRLQNIGEGFFRDDDAAYIPAEHAATLGDHSVLPGDLLIAGLGDDNNPVGRACVAPPDLGKTMVKADCFRFRLDDSQLSARFAAYQLCSCAKAIGSSLSTGATRSRINLTSVAAVQVVHPGLGEQQKIATHIDANSERMARLVARNLEAIDKLQEYRTALISAAVTGKIDVTEAAP